MSETPWTTSKITGERRQEIVDGLPRRTAHALYALLAATQAVNMPVRSSEIIVYDEEALSTQQTAAGLRHAARLGLAACINGLWVASAIGNELRRPLEERYCAETEM